MIDLYFQNYDTMTMVNVLGNSENTLDKIRFTITRCLYGSTIEKTNIQYQIKDVTMSDLSNLIKLGSDDEHNDYSIGDIKFIYEYSEEFDEFYIRIVRNNESCRITPEDTIYFINCISASYNILMNRNTN